MGGVKEKVQITYSEHNVSNESVETAEAPRTHSSSSNFQIAAILITLCGISTASTLGTGLVTIGIPQIASDLSLSNGLLLWPGAAYSLASGSCFLLAGSLADAVGSRTIGLLGCLVMAISLAVTGVAKTGIQFIVFRALQGIGAAMFLPTIFSLWTSTVPKGRMRNFGFACFALASPMGLQAGNLLAGAINPSKMTWRFGFYLSAGIIAVFFFLGYRFLPSDAPHGDFSWKLLLQEIDLIGVLLSSIGLGLLGYVLAELSNSVSSIQEPLVATLLALSLVLIVTFFVWMSIRERRGRKALVPNSFWRNSRFSVICLLVALCWAMSNSMDWFFSLFFQKVQGLSPMQAAIRYIPNGLIGIVTNFITGPLVDRLPINFFVTISCVLSTAGPLIMALIHPSWSYWIGSFWSLLLLPTAQDVIYTVSNVIITESMPKSQHGLAGAVFNTLSMLGTSIGIAVMAIVNETVIQNRSNSENPPPNILMAGYRAVFWTNLGLSATMTAIGAIGLRHVWYIGKAEKAEESVVQETVYSVEEKT